MNIALVSFEYPPKTAVGGIGTYFYQNAHLLKSRNHYVEVFSSSLEKEESIYEEGVLVHRIKTSEALGFQNRVLHIFKERESHIKFDLIEGPEYRADTLLIKRAFPNIPLHIKLHTPNYLVKKLNDQPLSLFQKFRFILGALRKFKKPSLRNNYDYLLDEEYLVSKIADLLSSPSKDLGRIVEKDWGIRVNSILPYPYTPSKNLLDITTKLEHELVNTTITFIGKLERRKGILLFIKIIPQILKKHPNTVFRFLGRPLGSPNKGMNMTKYLIKRLKKHKKNLDFKGEIPLNDLPKYLSTSSICIFPSLWENFPNVCLEAMAAGKCIIGSRNGGMAEMLDDDCGVLIDPTKPKDVTKAILELLGNPTLIYNYGNKARKKVLNTYNNDTIGELYDKTFKLLINDEHSD